MKRLRKIYFFALMGAAGGLTAAALHQILLLGVFARPIASLDRHIYDVILGLVVGAPIGFFPNFLEGRSHSSLSGGMRSGLIGALLGAVGGMLSVPMSELIHNHLGGGIPGRACAVGLLGMTVGIAAGVNGGSRWWRGIVGGLVGGLMAGTLLELLLESHVTYSDGAIIALILLGISISLFISIFVNVLSDAWLEGLPGSKIAGQIYQLSRFYEPNEAILGSDRKGQVFIWIPGAQERHTAITRTRKGARLRHAAKQGTTLVNGNAVSECMLKNGDVIQIESSRLRYRERSGAFPSQGVKFVDSTGAGFKASLAPRAKATRSLVIKFVLLAFTLPLGSILFAATDANVRITQIETFHGNKARVYVSITDAQGNPLPDSERVRLEIREAGRLVASQTVSEGWSVSSVLVLDLSGSMSGEKLRQAKAAVRRYIELAPAAYRIALVGFSDQASLVSDFETNKSVLFSRLTPLEAHGNTALQDAVAFALDRLKGDGRHTVLLVTDGRENKSVRFPGAPGEQSVIQAARDKSVTVSVMGLGSDVDRTYLKNFEVTGGTFLEAPRADQLTGLFEKTLGTISKERVVEYDSQLSPDGLREKLEAHLVSQEPWQPEQSSIDVKQVIPPGFIPDVKGDLRPYTVGLLLLLAVPGLWTFSLAVRSVWRFRNMQLKKLPAGSKLTGTRDPNGLELLPGSPVVACPDCSRIHSVRSWRYGRCACMVEPLGRGAVCLHRDFPDWLRHSLDKLTGGSTNAQGRVWLCHCAGDKEGY
jgi:uncharacterized protein YegL